MCEINDRTFNFFQLFTFFISGLNIGQLLYKQANESNKIGHKSHKGNRQYTRFALSIHQVQHCPVINCPLLNVTGGH